MSFHSTNQWKEIVLLKLTSAITHFCKARHSQWELITGSVVTVTSILKPTVGFNILL